MAQITKRDYMFAAFDTYSALCALIGDLTLPGAFRRMMMQARDLIENLLIADGVL